MSYHKRSNGTWFWKGRENGVQKTKNFGKGDVGRRAAKAYDHEFKSRKLRGLSAAPQTQNIYYDTLCQHYFDTKATEGKAGKWAKNFIGVLNNHILPGLPMKPVDQITQHEITSFIAEKYRDNSLITRNRYTSYLKVIGNYGVEHGLIQTNPLAKWKKAKEKPRQSTLTVGQLKQIKKHAAEHLKWAIEVAYRLGVRTGESELLSLRWDHINWDEGWIRVYASKTNSRRKIPIKEPFMSELKKRRKTAKSAFLVEYRGKQVKSLRKSFRYACNKAEIDKSITMYDIRHLFATTLLSKNGDLSSVSQLLGHKSTRLTADVYYHSLKEEKKRTIGLLPDL